MNTDPESIAYHAGDFRRLAECTVNVSTHALQYGTGVFGGMRAYYNPVKDNLFIFRMDRHYKRLWNSARVMQMTPPLSEKQMAEVTIEVTRRNNYRTNVYYRPFVYKSALQLSPRLHDVPDAFSLYTLRLNDYLDTTRGLRAAVSSWRRIDENIIPSRAKVSGGYANSALAKSEAVQGGFDEAIMLDTRGFVSEGSAENIFMVRDGVLITPPPAAAVLEGITARTVRELAVEEGIPVVERDIARAELYIADELFFSGTGAQVAWVTEVDRRQVGTGSVGPVTERIKNRFLKVVTGEDPKFQHWLTPVY